MEAEKKKTEKNNDKEMTFIEHLEELRKRVIKCIIGVSVGFIVSYIYSKELFSLLMRPLILILPKTQKQLVFTNPIQPFMVYLKVALIVGVFISSPLILFQLWRFISPGLYKNERKYSFAFLLLSIIFFIGGTSFGYFILLPISFSFLLKFAEGLIPMITINDALSLISWLLFGLGICFELPVFLLLMAKMGIISLQTITKNRKYAFLISFVVSAVVTPTPDLFTQCTLAIPLYILYEISIVLIKIFVKKSVSKSA